MIIAGCLLILSAILNIVTMIKVTKVMRNINYIEKHNKSENTSANKCISRMKNIFSIDSNFDDPSEYNKEEKIDYDKLEKFKDVYELLDYVSKYNLYIIDIRNEKKRKIKFMDKCTYNDKQSVIMTFDDGSEALFRPYLYAKCDDNN